LKYEQAKAQLQHALKHQKTISIPKLNTLLQSMNISFKPSESVEVKYLKSEIKKLRKQLKKNGGNESERISHQNRRNVLCRYK
jgi:hypothetical protein